MRPKKPRQIMLPRTPLGPSTAMPVIKRRFKDVSRLLKKVPANELFDSIIENSPFVGNVLERNWAKIDQASKKVDAVQEQLNEEEQYP